MSLDTDGSGSIGVDELDEDTGLPVAVDDIHEGKDGHRAVPQDVEAVQADNEQVLLPLEARQEENDAKEAAQADPGEKPQL